MSVLVDAITVVIRCDAIERAIPGGVPAFAESVPNRTFRTDGRLAAVAFMTHDDAEIYLGSLEPLGLRLADHGKSCDMVVIDMPYGPMLPCDWIDLGIDPDGTRFAWLRGTEPGTLAAPTWWRPGGLVRTDMFPDHLEVDPETGHRFFVDGTGAKHYLGEVFRPGDPETGGLQMRRRLLHAAREAAWNALLKRDWLGLTYFQSAHADFHVVMRYQNQLGLVFVLVNRGSTAITELDREKKDRLLLRAMELRGVAIVARCEFMPGNEGDAELGEPPVQSLDFEDARTGAPLREDKFDKDARIEISDWEVLDFAIAYVRRKLEETGYHIEHWMSEPLPGPHILARKDDTMTRIVVAGGRFPADEAAFERGRLTAVADATLLQGGQLARASVVFAHGDDPFTGYDVVPLYRGEPVVARYSGLEILDPNDVLGRPGAGITGRIKGLMRATLASLIRTSGAKPRE
jgi:hypothetical protein